MSRARRDLLLAALLAIGVALALLPYLSTRMPYDQDVAAIVREDEGTILCDARRIADGQVMYRDFFAFQTPGSYYFLGAAMKVGGRTIRCARLATLLTVGLTSGLLFLIGAAQLRSRWLATALSLVFPFGLFPFWPFAFPYWHCMLFVVGGLGLALWYVEDGSRRVLAAAGAAFGLAFLTIQSEGIPALAAVGGFLAARAVARPPREWRGIAAPLGRELAWLCGGFLLPCLACYGYFAAHGVLATMLYDNFIWPFTNYRGQYNITAYGQNLFRVLRDFKTGGDRLIPADANLDTYYQILALHVGVLAAAPLAVLGALAVFGAGAADTLRAMWGRPHRPSEVLFGEDAGLLLLALAALALVSPLFTGVTRKDTSHVAFLSLPGWLLLFRLAAPRSDDGDPWRRPFGRRVAALALGAWVASAAWLHARRAYWASARPGGLGFGDLSSTEADVARQQGGALIDFMVPPGGSIVWANYGGWPTFTSHRDDAIPFTLLVPPPMHDLGQWSQAAAAMERRLPVALVSEDERRHFAILSSVSPWVRERYFYAGELRPGADLYLYDGGGSAPPFAGSWQLRGSGLTGTLALQQHGSRLEGTLLAAQGRSERVLGATQPGQSILVVERPGAALLLVVRGPVSSQGFRGEAMAFGDLRPTSFVATVQLAPASSRSDSPVPPLARGVPIPAGPGATVRP